jgi:four helix bundle protein
MNEAARSSTRNIAEGYGRHHHKENTQFCRMSRGSLYELHDDLITALNAGYLDDQEASLGRELINRAIQVVNGYIRYLRSLS